MTPEQQTSATDNALVEKLPGLAVWPMSIADHYADVLTPRQIEMLYAASNAMHEAAERIKSLLAEVERLNALADEQARYANVKKDECSALKADRQRMREALEAIAGNGDATGCNPQLMCDTALEALTPASKEANDALDR